MPMEPQTASKVLQGQGMEGDEGSARTGDEMKGMKGMKALAARTRDGNEGDEGSGCTGRDTIMGDRQGIFQPKCGEGMHKMEF